MAVFAGRTSRQIPPFRRRKSFGFEEGFAGQRDGRRPSNFEFEEGFAGFRPSSVGLPAAPPFRQPAHDPLRQPPSFAFTEDERAGQFARDPGFAFNTALNQAGLDRNLTDFFRGKAGSFLSRFEGALGSELNKFGTENLNPLDFFRNIDFEQEFLRFSPSERGVNDAGLNRASRFLF